MLSLSQLSHFSFFQTTYTNQVFSLITPLKPLLLFIYSKVRSTICTRHCSKCWEYSSDYNSPKGNQQRKKRTLDQEGQEVLSFTHPHQIHPYPVHTYTFISLLYPTFKLSTYHFDFRTNSNYDHFSPPPMSINLPNFHDCNEWPPKVSLCPL